MCLSSWLFCFSIFLLLKCILFNNIVDKINDGVILQTIILKVKAVDEDNDGIIRQSVILRVKAVDEDNDCIIL